MTRAALLVLLVLWAPLARAPEPSWRLEPTGFETVNLCLKPCALKAHFVTGYRWAAY